MRNPIIAALDLPSAEAALSLVDELAQVVGAFKIGSELFTAVGPGIVKKIRDKGAAVFLDLKFHDIPNTVAKAVAAAVRLDVQMLTVHASGGMAILQAAEKSAQDTAQSIGSVPPLVLGVTVLTSMDSNELSEVGFQANVGRQVERLASLCVRVGMRGLVCSPLEIADLRAIIPDEIQLVTPGIRAETGQSDDQKRTMTAGQAMAAGANWLVVGRPICAAKNPRAAAEQILATLAPGTQ